MVKRLPVMRLSMVVQRLIEMERKVSRTWCLGVLAIECAGLQKAAGLHLSCTR
jgi:hypothetical protein